MTHATVVDAGPEERARAAIQLHTLRATDAPLPETIRRVADAGFEGVEFAGAFLESDPHAVRDALDDVGVTPVAAHVDLARIEGNPEAVADRLRHAGCRHAVVPHLGGGFFRTNADVDAIARRLDALAGRLDNYGVRLSYHVSREPFRPPLDRVGLGRLARLPSPGIAWRVAAEALDRTIRGAARTLDVTAFDRLVDRTDDLTFEVDVGWVAAGGHDPVAVFDRLGDRMSLIHVADVRRTARFPPAYESVPPGAGIVDLDRVLDAALERDVEWLVYEDDDPTGPDAAIEHGRSLFERLADGR